MTGSDGRGSDEPAVDIVNLPAVVVLGGGGGDDLGRAARRRGRRPSAHRRPVAPVAPGDRQARRAQAQGVLMFFSTLFVAFGREAERGKEATRQEKNSTHFEKTQKKTRKQVTVSDGRVLSGVLSCLDPQGNLVLSDTLTLGGGGGGGAGREGGEKGEAAATAAHPPPLSLDDGHHHSRSQTLNQNQPQQDHAMGMVIVPRARRVRCCVEVEGFEAGRVGAELARAMMEEEQGSER